MRVLEGTHNVDANLVWAAMFKKDRALYLLGSRCPPASPGWVCSSAERQGDREREREGGKGKKERERERGVKRGRWGELKGRWSGGKEKEKKNTLGETLRLCITSTEWS